MSGCIGRYILLVGGVRPNSSLGSSPSRGYAKDMPGPNQHIIFSLFALHLALASSAVVAAEIRGTVNVQQAGLFNASNASLQDFPVSVALYPAEGQLVARRAPERHAIVLHGQIQPLYLAMSRGDSLDFENRDNVYHELFTHSRTLPLEVRLDREGGGRQRSLTLNEIADLHWFCRIHAKSYSRIDVLGTPLVRMVRAGESFEFRDLQTGKWLVRVAAPGAETKILEAQALTAPPPLLVSLTVKGFGQGGQGVVAPQAASVEQLFPTRPGF